VLPKWQGEVVKRALVHPKLLIPADALARMAAAVAPGAGTLLQRGEGFASIAGDGGAIRLYAAQLVKAGQCQPVLRTVDGILLGKCRDGSTTYWLLADPDFIDNHGLTQGANARVAKDVLPRLAGGPVVIDLTTTAIFDEAPRQIHQRSWSELLRVFAPPFT